jgi:uncharacterized protein (DUF736 family)
MILGRFKESADGCFVGHIRTMFFKSDKIVFEPIPHSINPRAPAFRVYTGDEIELGAAWRKTNADGAVFYEVALDDPTFANTVFCVLRTARDGDGYVMFWERPRRKPKKPPQLAFREGTRATDALRAAGLMS